MKSVSMPGCRTQCALVAKTQGRILRSLVLTAFVPALVNGQTFDARLAGVDPGSNVLSVARLGNTVYIAGSFRSVGPNTGGGVPVNRTTGEPLRPFPAVAGEVYAAISDSSGGWYIGGRFTAVGGFPRYNLAHVLSDGDVSDWSPSADGDVASLASRGRTIYLGGWFNNVSGVGRRRIAAVDAETAEVGPWNPDVPDYWGSVNALVVQDSLVYAGGFFSYIGGQRRNDIAALDATTGLANDFDPEAQYTVNALAVRGDVVYAGGVFTAIGGQPRNMIAALDAHSGLALSFDARASGTRLNDYVPWNGVYALSLCGDTLYAGGYFDHMGGQPRICLAALDPTTGDAMDWNPVLGGAQYVYALAARHDAVYVGGAFTTVDVPARDFLAAFNPSTAQITAWNPRPNFTVQVLAATDQAIFVGGYFSSIWDWQRRIHIAALDATTGAVKPWNPNPDGFIAVVAASGGTVYAGGNFGTIGGQARPSVAALDTLTGAATNWNPGANGAVSTMRVGGRWLYVAGGFGIIGGVYRSRAAALDLATGEVGDWNPSPDDAVYAMAEHRGKVYLGGFFLHVGGQPRAGLAAVDTTTGAVASWNPGVDSFVQSLAVIGDTVFVGGAYSTIGGQARASLAAVDASSGAVLPWDPNPSPGGLIVPYVHALAAVGDTLYVGGDFGAIGGEPRQNFAAVDAVSGRTTPLNPAPDGVVWSLATSASTLYVGGGYARFGNWPCTGLVGIDFGPPAPPPPRIVSVTLPTIRPNPVESSAMIRFAIPALAPVTVEVFDAQGRRVETLVAREAQAAGWHELPLHAEGWPAGVYFCRLDAGGTRASRKFVVVR